MSDMSINPDDVKTYFKGILPPKNLESLRESGGNFKDPYFPPTDRSIDSKKSDGSYVDQEEGLQNDREMQGSYPKSTREWARPNQVNKGKWELFINDIKEEDVVQGSLGDCYFLSAVAALVEFKTLIKEKFPIQKYADIGYYEVVLFIDGEWVRVFVDDYFPVKKNYSRYSDEQKRTFAFAQPNGNELWCILLEKAWAKVNGGYSNTQGGNQYEVFLALTGFPSEILFNKSDTPLKIFKKIEAADKKEALMGCASYSQQGMTDKNVNAYNICYGHAYTLIDAKTHGESLSAIYLYKIRNPWGQGEYKGKWSDGDSDWTPDLKKFYDFQPKEDGIFFMDAEAYPENFQNTQICRIIKGAKMQNYVVDKPEFFNGAMVYNLHMLQKGDVVFTVVERNRRFNRNLPLDVFPFFSLFVFKYDQNRKVTKFIGGKSDRISLGICDNLDEGYYACVIFFPYDYLELEKNFKYIFTIYSSANFKSKYTGKDPNPNLRCLENLIISYFKTSKDFEISSAGQYIASDIKEISEKTNMTARVYYNNLNQKIRFTQNFANKQGYSIVGTFDEKAGKQPVELVLGKGKFGIVLLARTALQASYQAQCGISYGGAVERMPTINFEDYRLDNFLQFDFESDKDLISPKKKTEKENTLVTEDSAKDAPKLIEQPKKETKKKETQKKQEEPKPEEKKVIQQEKPKTDETTEYDRLKKKYPNEFKVMEDNIKERQSQIPLNWVEYESLNGTYIGQIDSEGKPCGRGIYKFANGQTYIGRFNDGKMDEFGYIFTPENKLIYKGELSDGKPNGSGLLYKGGDNYWAGNYVDGKLQGYGVAHDEKGNEWVGPYTDNKENGVGLMKQAEPEVYALYKYDNEIPTDQIPLLKEEISYLKQKREKISNLEQQYLAGNSSIEEVNKARKEFLDNLEDLYKYKKANGIDKSPSWCVRPKKTLSEKDKKKKKISDARRKLKKNDEEGEKNLKDSVIKNQDQVKEENEKKEQEKKKQQEEGTYMDVQDDGDIKFMVHQLKDMYPFYTLSDMGMRAKKSNDKEILIRAKRQEQDQGHTAYFDGKNYYIGNFDETSNEPIPNGLIRKFDKYKKILAEGQMHKPFKFDDGTATLWDSQGIYEGEIKNEKANGEGTYTFFNSGDRYTGTFKDGLLDGKGVYMNRKGYEQYRKEYTNDKEKSQQIIKPQDLFYNPISGTLGFLGDDEGKDTLFSYLNEIPPLLTKNTLKWGIMKGKDSSYYNYYLGQVVESSKVKEGRGIICNTGYDNRHHFVGQFRDGKKDGLGVVLNKDFELEFKGMFKDDYPNGQGSMYINGYIVHGDFKNGELHGIGSKVPEDCEGYSIEGVYKEGTPYNITKMNMGTNTTQNLFYDLFGNIDDAEDEIETLSPDYELQVAKNNKALSDKYGGQVAEDFKKIQELPKEIKMNFNTTVDFDKDGRYVGEVDGIGLRCGRGKLTNLYNGNYYLGHFFNNKQHGQGGWYLNGKPKYEGEFQYGFPCGKGTYHIQNEGKEEIVEGTFDENGSGIGYVVDPVTRVKGKDRYLYALKVWDPTVLNFIKKKGEY